MRQLARPKNSAAHTYVVDPSDVRSSYEKARPYIHRGCPVFFQGADGAFTKLIQFATGIPTHVSAATRTEPISDGTDRVIHIESTTLNRMSGKRGVHYNYLSERIEEYKGHVWIAPLNPQLLQVFDADAAIKFAEEQEGKGYDYFQAATAGLRQILGILPSISFKNQHLCSELVTGMVAAGAPFVKRYGWYSAIPTPNQLSKWPIYRMFIQVKCWQGKEVAL